MGANSFGTGFVVTTFGESHAGCIGVVVDGCPPGIIIDADFIKQELNKRRPSADDVSSLRVEDDEPEIISGVFDGKTTGAPIAILIKNNDAKPSDYDEISKLYRPGHADYTYEMKYGHVDRRGGGRYSARETASRVAAGAVAKAFLELYGIELFTHVVSLGDIHAKAFDKDFIYENSFRCADREAASGMAALTRQLKAEGDSMGGVVELVISGVPAGIGEPLFDKLDARLAYAMMGIPAVKGVEIGAGFKSACMKGSENNDQMDERGFLSNNAGGILGGISNGNDIVLRVAFKPIPTIAKEQKALKKDGSAAVFKGKGRHDVSAAPRGAAVVEAMAWLVLADMMKLAAKG